jgi:hypothetical protein
LKLSRLWAQLLTTFELTVLEDLYPYKQVEDQATVARRG